MIAPPPSTLLRASFQGGVWASKVFRVPRAGYTQACGASPPTIRRSRYPFPHAHPCLQPGALRVQHQGPRRPYSRTGATAAIPDGHRSRNEHSSASGGRTRNHLHALLALPPAVPLAKAVQELKGNSSPRLNGSSNRFAWQRGYGAFSVSESRRQAVIAYIAGQEEHHRKWTFEQEFLTLLRNSKIEFDPRLIFRVRSAVPGALGVS